MISPGAVTAAQSDERRINSQLQARAAEGDYLQFGCGLCAPASWKNFDAGPAFWLQRKFPLLKGTLVKRGYPNYPGNVQYGDIITGLPVRPSSARAVYCSHVLEHLALEEFRSAIRNVYSYLVSGGLFRLVVPDVEYLIRSYVADGSTEAAPRFMKAASLGQEHGNRGMKSLAHRLFGRSQHLWMWDYKSIAWELEKTGFTGIRRAAFGDSPDPRFTDVEDPGRWENCLGVECTRF